MQGHHFSFQPFKTEGLFTVFSRDYAITCVWKEGALSIISIGSILTKNMNEPPKTIRELCLDIIAKCPGGIGEVIEPKFDSNIAKEVCTYMKKFVHGYDAVVGVLLNPHTYLGKKRLYSEFELLIE